jgi:radical SAM protein with 4Fe4S-binding SPASM domain
VKRLPVLPSGPPGTGSAAPAIAQPPREYATPPATPPAPPEEVKIRLLQPCDLRCGMCWHWQDPDGRQKRLPAELLHSLFAELAALGVARVKLTGGEPTLRADLPRLVEGARAAGLRVTLATNAFSLSPPRLATLVRAGVDTFHVSLDGAEAATHDAIRGVPGAFARSVAALRNLRDAHPQVRCKLATVVQAQNCGRLAGLVQLAAELSAREVYLLLVQTEAFCEKEALTPAQLEQYFFSELPQLLQDGVAKRVRVRSSPLFRALLPLPPAEQAVALRQGPAAYKDELRAYEQGAYGQYFYSDRPCQEITARAEIAETGEVYPCCHTELPELSMGNVYREPFAAIWARSSYRAFRDPQGPLPRHARCLTCKDSHYA